MEALITWTRKIVEQASHQLQTVINLLRKKYNNPKVILGEITPRTECKDEEIKMCRLYFSGEALKFKK